MLFFLCDPKGSLIYLLNNKQYVVGRKDCDIIISNDQSISRKHASLTVKNNKVILCDCGSRYNTFIDETKVEAQVEVTLMHGNEIRFGRLQSIYIFNEKDLITTTSSIKSRQKAIFTNNIKFLGGTVIQNWNKQCTHVTVEEIVLTVKVLCAIINGTPIVTLKFWDDYVESVKNNLLAPDFKNYLPPCSEIILNYQNISLKYREARKSLFKNKVFLFSTEEEKARMDDMIKLAGGEAISFEENPITRTVIKDSLKEYLVMVNETPSSNPLQDIVSYLNEQGKRTIPLQEIALAIITCSCEKDCNPNFDRKGTVLQAKTQTQKFTGNILAGETQSQNLLSVDTHSIKAESVIPESMEFSQNLVIANTQSNPELINSGNIEETTVQIKREGDSLDDVQASKKIKIEREMSFVIKNRGKKDVNNPPEVVKETPGKSLFTFKNDKSQNENNNPEPKNVVNPFAKKRKATQNENEKQLKKPALFNDIVSSQQPSTSKSISASPFGSILRSKSKNSEVFPTKQVTKKARNIASSTLINNQVNDLQVDLSAIEKVDSSLEKSYGWISKSNCNSTGKVNGFENEIEAEISKYIESFKNTVVIEEEELLVVKKPSVRDNNNDTSVCNNNLKNFKTFKKVKPLNVQTTIIPEAKYMNVVCNEKCAISVEDSGSDASDIDTQDTTTRKTKGRRFDF